MNRKAHRLQHNIMTIIIDENLKNKWRKMVQSEQLENKQDNKKRDVSKLIMLSVISNCTRRYNVLRDKFTNTINGTAMNYINNNTDTEFTTYSLFMSITNIPISIITSSKTTLNNYSNTQHCHLRLR